MKYKRTFLLTLIIAVVFIYSYKNKYDAILSNFVSFADSTQYSINQNIKLSSDFIDLMSTYGSVYYNIIPKNHSELLSKLAYDPQRNIYSLDSIKGTPYEKFIGNLSGEGHVPTVAAMKQELTMAFQLNSFFHNFYDSLPGIAWIYYTSKSKFINIYPWIQTKEFKYTNELHEKEFYTMCLPASNPGRQKIWTPIYLDLAGKGLMVTVSAPIYDHDTFKGTVSLDFTLNQINSILKHDFDAILVNNTNQVIATNELDLSKSNDIVHLSGLLKSFSKNDLTELNHFHTNQIRLYKHQYFYIRNFNNCPWQLYFVLPEKELITKSLLYSLPILIIGVLLLISNLETESRRRTELKLKNTVSELNSFQELLKNTANLDYLTNTYNRRGMTEKILEEVARYSRTKNPFSFIMCDIDHFKNFNDQYGHATGDRVLIEIATTLKLHLRRTDHLCRWGGEEFLIMLCNAHYESAMLIAENLRFSIQNLEIPGENGEILKVTMTFGVGEYNHDTGYEASISNVDTALYEGKNSGRNRVTGYAVPTQLDHMQT